MDTLSFKWQPAPDLVGPATVADSLYGQAIKCKKAVYNYILFQLFFILRVIWVDKVDQAEISLGWRDNGTTFVSTKMRLFRETQVDL